jgi:hypothetical protein
MLGTIQISISHLLYEENMKIRIYKIIIDSVVLVSYSKEGRGLRVRCLGKYLGGRK